MSEKILEMLTDLGERMSSIGEQVSEERLLKLVADTLPGLLEEREVEFTRKFRFAGAGDAALAGGKFSRYGYSVADVEFLYDVMSATKQGPSEELRTTFGAVSEALYMPMEQVRAIDKQAIDGLFPRVPLAQFRSRADRDFARRGMFDRTGLYRDAVRAMDTAESGYGSQLVGAQYVADLWEGARKESRLFSLIDTFEMSAPTAYVPVEADLPEMLFVSENTASDASNYATSKSGSNRVTVAAKKFIIHQMWSGELEEDSIVPFVPYIRRQAQLSLQHYSDSVVLNGDTTNAGTGNINLDDADPADTKHYLAMDGIRHAALVGNTANTKNHSGAAITLSALLGLRELMLDATYLMDWGSPTIIEDLVYTGDPTTCKRIALLDEVITVDKYGPKATVLTGEVASVGGHPLINSVAMSKTEADGKVSTTGGNNTLGQVGCFNRRGLKIGWRRRVRTEVERIPATDQTRLVHSLRLGLGRFSPTGAASGIEWAAVLRNISLA